MNDVLDIIFHYHNKHIMWISGQKVQFSLWDGLQLVLVIPQKYSAVDAHGYLSKAYVSKMKLPVLNSKSYSVGLPRHLYVLLVTLLFTFYTFRTL